MQLFFEPEIARGFLSEEESQHAVKVLRLQSGDEISIIDGRGGLHQAEITLAHPKKCGFSIIESKLEYGKRNYKLHIAIAPTKNIDRFEWFVEKAVEIGIDEITPLICRFSERKVLKTDRIEKIIVSASKQSLKAYVPKLNEAISFNDFLKQNHDQSACFIAHCYNNDKQEFRTLIQKQEDILILIGPEGDFSETEVQDSLTKGFKAVSMGSSRLRTETAGVVACTLAAFK
jgi:16S rRNA (uracil1498-N3)-methyltransferase